MRVHVNYSEMCTPDVHAEGCRDQAKARRKRGYAGSEVVEVSSIEDIAVHYWSDFVGGFFDGRLDTEEEAIYEALMYTLGGEPHVYPCVDLPTYTEGEKA